MSNFITYSIILFLLLIAEILYFRVADYFNIIDKPNERSSHSTVVLRGGGIIFLIGAWLWFVSFSYNGAAESWPFMIGLTMAAVISFADDIKSLPDSVRLVVQFIAIGLMLWNIGLFEQINVQSGISITNIHIAFLVIITAMIVCIGATNIINFMDGINGITGTYALASLIPLAFIQAKDTSEYSLTISMILASIVFLFFNLRPRGKAKCFAGDVGSVSVAIILLFLIGKMIMVERDVTWLVFLVIYGLDGVITICHRILLHEHLGKAHRKHSYQLMANELKMSHITVSLLYAFIQLTINLIYIYIVPNTIICHWIYLSGCIIIFGSAFLLFRKKYYHLHEEFLANLHK